MPAVRLNEVLPAPRAVDWDRSGGANIRDEWIELTNGSGRSVNIGGWSLDVGRGRGRAYRIPRGTVLRPGAYLVLYRAQTGLTLDDASGQVRLLDADGPARRFGDLWGAAARPQHQPRCAGRVAQRLAPQPRRTQPAARHRHADGNGHADGHTDRVLAVRRLQSLLTHLRRTTGLRGGGSFAPPRWAR